MYIYKYSSQTIFKSMVIKIGVRLVYIYPCPSNSSKFDHENIALVAYEDITPLRLVDTLYYGKNWFSWLHKFIQILNSYVICLSHI